MTNILVVDDNSALRAALHDLLSAAGHAVTTAANGAKAVDLVRNGDIALVITDLFMPEREGIETIIELRRHFPQLRIIAISGGGGGRAGEALAPERNLQMARKLGATVTLAKPFTPQQLADAVALALA
jgi:CheY-like chemotaxis protein